MKWPLYLVAGANGLESTVRETEFREACFPSDRKVVTGLAILTMFFLIVCLPSALALRETAGQREFLWIIRALDFVGAGIVVLLMRRVTSIRKYDAIVTVWLAIWFCTIVVENALLPRAVVSYVAWDVFITLAVFTVVPLPFARQALLATIIAAGDLLVLWTIKAPARSMELSDVTFAYLCAFVVGMFVSRMVNACRRTTFAAMKEHILANEKLQVVLREVKTLRGTIPICSFCKDIRTAVGDWQLVEHYVSDHSDAEFSHDICPDCRKQHYPGVPVPC